MQYDLTSCAMTKSVISALIINFEASINEKNRARVPGLGLFNSIAAAHASVTLSPAVTDELDVLDYMNRESEFPLIFEPKFGSRNVLCHLKAA